jgi:hypothetical protein
VAPRLVFQFDALHRTRVDRGEDRFPLTLVRMFGQENDDSMLFLSEHVGALENACATAHAAVLIN